MTTTKQQFHGVDASNEISLLEYGLLLSNKPHEDNSGSYFAVYKVSDNCFDWGHLYPNEINGLIEGKEWANNKDIESFLSFVGQTKKEWLTNTLINKISDLIQYWGAENICGTSHNTMTEQEAKERYLV